MLHRRRFCQALAGSGVTVAALCAAQSPAKVYRLGLLSTGRLDSAPSPLAVDDPFRTELARLGLVEGVNLVIDVRTGRGDPALLDGAAAELVFARPDVLFTTGGFRAARALKNATSTIPIVFAAMGEPVAAGLVASLARPGGNLTGGELPNLELKRIQILIEALGSSASIAMLTTPVSERRMAVFLQDLAATRLQLKFHEVTKREDLAPAFENMARQRVAGVAVAASILTASYQPEIASLVARHRLPAIADGSSFADLGLMMSYSVDWAEVMRKAANYVYKIMKGAQPADLPVEQATKFDFVINLKSARALGVRVPSSVLIAATRVIE